MKTVWNFTLRVIAVFVMSALSTIGAGAILQIDILKTALLAGIIGLARVVEDVAREFISDGLVTKKDFDKVLKHIAETYQKND